MDKLNIVTARRLNESGCTANGVTSRHMFFTIIGAGTRGSSEISRFGATPGSYMKSESVEKLSSQENLLVLMNYENHLYLAPAEWNQERKTFTVRDGMFGGNYLTGDSMFIDMATSRLHSLVPEASQMRFSYPLPVHDRFEW